MQTIGPNDPLHNHFPVRIDPDDPKQWADAYRMLADEVRILRNSIRLKIFSTYLSGIATGLALAFILWVLAGIFP